MVLVVVSVAWYWYGLVGFGYRPGDVVGEGQEIVEGCVGLVGVHFVHGEV